MAWPALRQPEATARERVLWVRLASETMRRSAIRTLSVFETGWRQG
jgi:hypothetical protein